MKNIFEKDENDYNLDWSKVPYNTDVVCTNSKYFHDSINVTIKFGKFLEYVPERKDPFLVMIEEEDKDGVQCYEEYFDFCKLNSNVDPDPSWYKENSNDRYILDLICEESHQFYYTIRECIEKSNNNYYIVDPDNPNKSRIFVKYIDDKYYLSILFDNEKGWIFEGTFTEEELVDMNAIKFEEDLKIIMEAIYGFCFERANLELVRNKFL